MLLQCLVSPSACRTVCAVTVDALQSELGFQQLQAWPNVPVFTVDDAAYCCKKKNDEERIDDDDVTIISDGQ